MKKILLLVLASFICGSAAAQTNLYKKKVLIGEVKNDSFNFVVDTKDFLKAINKEFADGFDHMEIKTGETTGLRTEKIYYLDITSSRNGAKMVRWLNNKDGKLYMVNTLSEKNQYKSYFTACTGTGNCEPTLYIDNDFTAWICGDKPVCLPEGQGKPNPNTCTRSITMLTRY
jgi:hypothetical protein